MRSAADRLRRRLATPLGVDQGILLLSEREVAPRHEEEVAGLLLRRADGQALDSLAKLDDRLQARGVPPGSHGQQDPLKSPEGPYEVTIEKLALCLLESVVNHRPPDSALIICLCDG